MAYLDLLDLLALQDLLVKKASKAKRARKVCAVSQAHEGMWDLLDQSAKPENLEVRVKMELQVHEEREASKAKKVREVKRVMLA